MGNPCQWLGLHAFTAKGLCSIPGWGPKIPHTTQHSPNRKQRFIEATSGKSPLKNVGIITANTYKTPTMQQFLSYIH